MINTAYIIQILTHLKEKEKRRTYLQLIKSLDAGCEVEAIQLHWKWGLPILFKSKDIKFRCYKKQLLKVINDIVTLVCP